MVTTLAVLSTRPAAQALELQFFRNKIGAPAVLHEPADGGVPLSTVSTTTDLGYQTQPRADEPARDAGDGAKDPVYLGLTLGAWLMIGTVAVLMAITYWPNLRRLYLKVNPFTGEPNWSHSVVIPIMFRGIAQ